MPKLKQSTDRLKSRGLRCTIPTLAKRRRGRVELADAVIDDVNQPNNFKFLYELNVPLRTRIEMIAEQVYGADGVDFTPEALTKVKALESDPDISKNGNLHG